ncbi:hypothetical protein CDO52_09950 [Nocardiopsis gilva YIM 90087]|uniref:Uncharacterized protein n=1 Tax=Nocardiopsis gilva YIM 90087 TaxID=1235441 RepID=A0A223S4K6_9ACTN|nr:hypothetical protein [Nocardiopsis gilva]ASU83062.1 hypothetical protein CDO52_09950 [Nocardiopsis gilva YIM 90087]
MKWLLTRILAGLAALLVVVVGAGALLAAQYTGSPAAWAVSTGHNAAWLGESWVQGKAGREAYASLASRVERGGISELYVYVGEIDDDGTLAPEGYAAASEFLAWAEKELPDVRVLGWMNYTTEGSSLVQDRFDEEQRDAVAAAAGAVRKAGFDGVHLAVAPVTTNDPSLPKLVAQVRTAIGADSVLSVQVQPVELVPGARVPSFVLSGQEKYWSKGYLARVTEQADIVVVPGHGSGMPLSSLYGGFMVREVAETLSALDGPDATDESEEPVAVRFGVPAFDDTTWGEPSGAESVETAVEAVRIGLTDSGERDNVGMAVYLLDDADAQDWDAFLTGWVDVEG